MLKIVCSYYPVVHIFNSNYTLYSVMLLILFNAIELVSLTFISFSKIFPIAERKLIGR